MTDKRVLARDDDGWYSFFTGEPYKSILGEWEADGDVQRLELLSPEGFYSIYGCHLLRKGRKAEVESITIKLKGK